MRLSSAACMDSDSSTVKLSYRKLKIFFCTQAELFKISSLKDRGRHIKKKSIFCIWNNIIKKFSLPVICFVLMTI